MQPSLFWAITWSAAFSAFILSLSQISCQVIDGIVVGDAFEIEYLAAEDRGKYLMLFRGGQDEDGVWRWLFRSF